MIGIDNSFPVKYRSAWKKARTERIRCVRLEDNLFYVSRRDTKRKHGRYLVRLFWIPTVGGDKQLKMQCRDIENNPCRGCYSGKACAHIGIVVLRAFKRGRRMERQSEAA